MPPSTTMHRIMIDSMMVKLSGLTKPWKPAKSPPETPPKLAPIANASSFTSRVLMPIAAPATSSSRIAAHPRPPAARSPQPHRNEDHGDHEREEQVVVVVDRGKGEAEDGVRLPQRK